MSVNSLNFDIYCFNSLTKLILLLGDQNKLQKMVQMSWTFVNDSLCTTLSLQWEPEIVAIAVMYLAVKLSKFEVKDWANRLPHQVINGSLFNSMGNKLLDLFSLGWRSLFLFNVKALEFHIERS